MANKRTFATLRYSRDFAKLKEQGGRVRPCSWMVLSYLPNELANLRCGWTISKKVGNAVIRNRLKRWCRHYFRSAKAQTSMGLDLNVILLQQPTNFYKELEHDEFEQFLSRGWHNILKRIEPSTASARRRLPK